MKKLGKFLIVCVCIIIAIMAFASCGSNSDDVKATDNSDKAEEVKPYEITIESKGYEDGGYVYKIVGILKNNKKDVDYIQIEIPVYDKDGNKLDSAWTNCSGLKKGETWKFEASCFGQGAEKIGDPEVTGF